MTKKRTLNELRQTKEYTKNPWALYGPPKIGSEGEVELEEQVDLLTSFIADKEYEIDTVTSGKEVVR